MNPGSNRGLLPERRSFEQLLNEADGDLRQYVQDVLLEAWSLYDRTDARSKRTDRLSLVALVVSIVAVIVVLGVRFV